MGKNTLGAVIIFAAGLLGLWADRGFLCLLLLEAPVLCLPAGWAVMSRRLMC